MNERKAILFQRVIAGFFLALFLFVHVIKATHHHPDQSITQQASKQAAFSQKSDCSVCDYHITKDSYQFDDILQVPLVAPLEVYSFFNNPFVTSIGSTSSGRGPPALV